MTTTTDNTFTIDLNDPYATHHIVGDINDHLLDAGKDDDAGDFIYRVKGLDDSSLDEILSIAADYVDIEDVSDARGIRGDQYLEDDPVSGEMSWDSEAAAIKRMLSDSSAPHAPMSAGPVDLTVPEYPDIEMEWDFESPLDENMLTAIGLLADQAGEKAVRLFAQDWRGLRSHHWTYKAMFQLVWSYIRVYPIPDQYGSDTW